MLLLTHVTQSFALLPMVASLPLTVRQLAMARSGTRMATAVVPALSASAEVPINSDCRRFMVRLPHTSVLRRYTDFPTPESNFMPGLLKL
jgi:hypothetical protein